MALPIIIDIEASGFGRQGYPIEVGFIDENKKTWCALIKPEKEWLHWDVQAESIHKISRAVLEQHGKSAELIASQLNEILSDKVVYTDGWAHDYVWLNQLFASVGQTPRFKLQDLRYILNETQMTHWHTTKDTVVQEMAIVRHRASADAKVLQQTWLQTKALVPA